VDRVHFERKERENREGGSVEGKERQGAPSTTTVSFLSNRTEEGGLTGRPAGGGAAHAGGPVHCDGREVGQNGEEAEGISASCSPWAEVACGGSSAVRSERQRRNWWCGGARDVCGGSVAR
jgi:hypothetical protein